MINFTQKGSFDKTTAYLNRMKQGDIFAALERFGVIGAEALSSATPQESGETSSSWTYSVIRRRGYFSIVWRNTHVEGGSPIAVLLQYGHGTGTGGYVQGRDYINPAIRPIFDKITAEAWKEVTR